MTTLPSARRTALLAAFIATATGCASLSRGDGMDPLEIVGDVRVTTHRGQDDLLTAGLGIDGLRGPAPAFADPASPTPEELRRRAIWSNWRGIADLGPQGGFGTLYGSTSSVPGREFHAFARLPGARQPHRVAVQVPDAFDTKRRCIVVAPASGSRGVYGAISVAASWALPRGCAVAYTDKGAGTDYFDLDAGVGVGLDGTSRRPGDAPLGFEPAAGGEGVAFKHAHSGDNPEADWGRHVRQAAFFALASLDDAFPAQAPFRPDNTTIIAAAISNGGGAVLRAAELDGDWLDGVVAGEPNVAVPGAPPLYDIGTEAALLMPCALGHLKIAVPPSAGHSCGALAEARLVDGADDASRARAAYDILRARGWSDEALRAGALSVTFDLWRAVTATYASAYGRFGPEAHPCGLRFSAADAQGDARAATAVERAAWWSDSSGIPPGAGVSLRGSGATPLADLQCLRALWTGQGDGASRVRAGIEAARAGPPRAGLPVLVVHGVDDGLVPMAFTSTPYVREARGAGRDVRFWQVENAQHFDAFLAMPTVGPKYVPLIPYVHAALDGMWRHLFEGAPLPDDARVRSRPRPLDTALAPEHLQIPAR